MCLHQLKDKSVSLFTHQYLKVYTEAHLNRVPSHVPSPDGLNNTLLCWGCVPWSSFDCRTLDRPLHQTSGGGAHSDYWGAAYRSVIGQVLSVTSSNNGQVAKGWGKAWNARTNRVWLLTSLFWMTSSRWVGENCLLWWCTLIQYSPQNERETGQFSCLQALGWDMQSPSFFLCSLWTHLQVLACFAIKLFLFFLLTHSFY